MKGKPISFIDVQHRILDAHIAIGRSAHAHHTFDAAINLFFEHLRVIADSGSVWIHTQKRN